MRWLCFCDNLQEIKYLAFSFHYMVRVLRWFSFSLSLSVDFLMKLSVQLLCEVPLVFLSSLVHKKGTTRLYFMWGTM